jgi:hypothetical protein
MKSILYPFLLAIAFSFSACSTTSENTEEKSGSTEQEMDEQGGSEAPKKKKPASPKAQAMAMIGNNHIHIDYASPSVRGRVIWGGLVPYGTVWSTGAHKATSINFPEPVTINGNELAAGKYGFFTIPGEETWNVILNKVWDMHLADDYQESEDVMRFEVTPEKMDNITEALAYKVASTGDNTGTISVAWEYIQISFEVTNK